MASLQHACDTVSHMVTYGQRKQREQRRAQEKATTPQPTKQHGNYHRPNRDTCEEQDATMFFTNTALTRVTGKTWRQAGRLVDFYLKIEQRTSTLDEWHTKITLDCAHGHLHAHYYEDEHKRPAHHLLTLDTVSDLKRALGVAIDYTRKQIDHLEQAER